MKNIMWTMQNNSSWQPANEPNPNVGLGVFALPEKDFIPIRTSLSFMHT